MRRFAWFVALYWTWLLGYTAAVAFFLWES